MGKTDEDDIDVPSPWDGVGDAPDEMSVLELLQECQKVVRNSSVYPLANASYNERLINGDQFLEISNGDVQDITDWPSFVPRTSRNLLRNLSLTWSSRILEDSPWVQCFASEPGLDEQKAEVANKILENCRQRHDFESMQFDAAQLVQPHTAVGFKTVWDPLAGPPSPGTQTFDENGVPVYGPDGQPVLEGKGEPTGDVVWQIVSVFDYGTDGNEHIENSQWCYFTTMMDEFDARSLLAAAGLDTDISAETYTDIWGCERQGVLVTELWWRPSSRFPHGLFTVTVANKAVTAIPYPYEHGELPLGVWKCGSRRNSPYGSSHVDDAVFIQRVINECVAALTQQARQIGSVKLVGPSTFIEALNSTNAQMFPVDDPQMSASIRYIDPPPRSEVLVQTLEDNTQALYAVYGLNEMLSGAESAKSGTSAKSIAYLNKLDSMKSAGASRSLNKAVLRMCRQTLKLYQQYVKAPRLAAIVGEKGLEGAEEFLGADLMGVDVKMESSSAKTQMRGEIAGNAQDQMSQGNPDPALREISRTGVADTAYARASRDILRAQAEAALRGEPQQPDNEVDASLAVAELSNYLANSRGSPGAGQLQALLQQYQQRAQAQAVQPQQPQGQGQ